MNRFSNFKEEKEEETFKSQSCEDLSYVCLNNPFFFCIFIVTRSSTDLIMFVKKNFRKETSSNSCGGIFHVNYFSLVNEVYKAEFLLIIFFLQILRSYSTLSSMEILGLLEFRSS